MTKWHVCPAKTQNSLGMRPVWSESSLSAWRSTGFLVTHRAHSEDWSDWADAQADLSLLGSHAISLVLSWGGTYCQIAIAWNQWWNILYNENVYIYMYMILHWFGDYTSAIHHHLFSLSKPSTSQLLTPYALVYSYLFNIISLASGEFIWKQALSKSTSTKKKYNQVLSEKNIWPIKHLQNKYVTNQKMQNIKFISLHHANCLLMKVSSYTQ